MAKLIRVIRDYKKAPKTGFTKRAVFIRALELTFSATFNTTGPTKTTVYYSHRAMLSKY